MPKQITYSKKLFSSDFFSALNIILCVIFFTTMSCKKECGKTSDPFVSCCTYDVTTFQDGDRGYAIPTLFTDNMDGINDGFVIFYSPVAVNDTIVSLRVFDDINVLIFESSLKAIKYSSTYLWDGLVTSGPGTGERYRGAFSYEAIIRGPSGPAVTIVGQACMVSEACDARANITNCVFGTQHNGNAEFNTDLPTLEDCQ